VPELPEVESVRRSLEPWVLGRRVLDAALHRRDVLVAPGDPPGGFSRQRGRGGRREPRPAPVGPGDLLGGTTVTAILRRGKQLAIVARADAKHAGGPERVLGVQLGMTGLLEFVPAGRERPRAHVHAEWAFEHGTMVFSDARRFGGLRALPTREALDAHWAALGPDALTISPVDLAEGLRGSRRAVKAALLDQGVLAGVGNIYADEALFLAGLPPGKLAARLRPDEVVRLATAIRTVLGEAVGAGGSTLRDFLDASGSPGSYQDRHRVYGRGGRPCPSCGTTLKQALLAQRTTVWCPRCQPARRRR
jgi:formamidopyrimidine-DNA glycosylase